MAPVSGLSSTVVMFSTADWRERYWTNKQHIAKRLAARGFDVLYIESTGLRRPGANARDLNRLTTRMARAFRSPERVDEHLWVHAPLTIPVARGQPWVETLNGTILGSSIKRWLKARNSVNPIVWAYHPYYREAVSKLSIHALIYHCVDDLAAIPGVDAEAFRTAEARLLSEADLVFATSPSLAAHCSALAGERVIFERNVADLEHFAKARTAGPIPAEMAAIPEPRLTYVGVLSDFKLDLDLIERSALALRDCHFVMIGEEPERQRSEQIARMRRLPNVHFLGFRPYTDLPSFLRATTIALLPNLTTGYMAGVFPMKFYEYLAAGRPIVTTPLPALETTSGPVAKAKDAGEWKAAIERFLLTSPAPLGLTDPELAPYSWDARLDRMLQRVAEIDPNSRLSHSSM